MKSIWGEINLAVMCKKHISASNKKTPAKLGLFQAHFGQHFTMIKP